MRVCACAGVSVIVCECVWGAGREGLTPSGADSPGAGGQSRSGRVYRCLCWNLNFLLLLSTGEMVSRFQ